MVSVVLLAPALVACDPVPPSPESCTITGTAGDDTLTGTEGADVICGQAGNDFIVGLGGNDTISGGPGNDRLNPGIGDDLVFGEDGDDQVFYRRPGPGSPIFPADGDGDDRVYLGAGTDSALAGSGNDLVRSGPNGTVTEELRGEGGNDDLYLDEGSTGYLIGGEGNDYLEGNHSNAVILGEGGNDAILSVSPGVLVTAVGGTGNDLAVLLDGWIDVFTVGDVPSSTLPGLGTPCSFAIGQSEPSIDVTCPLFSGGIGIDAEGTVTFANGIGPFRTEMQVLTDSGGPETDTCYCDIDIEGFPMVGDQIQ
jgi:Ca2+-binding RTX toxin-like protein